MSESSMKYSTLVRVVSLVGVFVGVLYFSPSPQERTQGVVGNPVPSQPELLDLARSLSAAEAPSWSEEDKAQAQLGKKIFFDPGFSEDSTKSCAFCHQPQRYFTDGRALAIGRKELTRHTPSIVNSFAEAWLYWDGRAASLEAQAISPLEAVDEHGFDRGRIVHRVWQSYRKEFEQVYGPWPKPLVTWLQNSSDHRAKPLEPRIEIEAQVADYALSSISDKDLQDPFLKAAKRSNISPHSYFATHVFNPDPVPSEVVARYANLPEDVRVSLEEALAKILQSIAQYERGLLAIDSPFDRFVKSLPKGDSGTDLVIENYFTKEFGTKEWRGYKTFVQASCTLCHSGPFFTDQQFHNIGLAQRGSQLDLGRAVGILRARNNPFNCPPQGRSKPTSESCQEWEYLRWDNPEMVGAFKTPSLRNVAETAPYMHDGRFKDLDDVLSHYSELSDIPAVGHRAETLQALRFTKDQKQDLKAFLESLTSPIRDLSL